MSDKKKQPRSKGKRKKYVPPGFEAPIEFNRRSLLCNAGPLTDFGECSLDVSN